MDPYVIARISVTPTSDDVALLMEAHESTIASHLSVATEEAGAAGASTEAVQGGGCHPRWDGDGGEGSGGGDEGGGGGEDVGKHPGRAGWITLPYAIVTPKKKQAAAGGGAAAAAVAVAVAAPPAVSITLDFEVWNENTVADDLVGVGSLDVSGMLHSQVRFAFVSLACTCFFFQWAVFTHKAHRVFASRNPTTTRTRTRT